MKFKKLLIGLPLVATTMLPMMAISCKDNEKEVKELTKFDIWIPSEYKDIEKIYNIAVSSDDYDYIKDQKREIQTFINVVANKKLQQDPKMFSTFILSEYYKINRFSEYTLYKYDSQTGKLIKTSQTIKNTELEKDDLNYGTLGTLHYLKKLTKQ